MIHPFEYDFEFRRRVEEYVAWFAADFRQSKPVRWAGVYLQGLLLQGDRKSIESLARRAVLPPTLPDKDPEQALQHFISYSPWDEQSVWRRYRALMAASFASRVGCFVVDDAWFPKQGRHSVGVHRQPCGPAARKRNCQVAMALHYVSPLGHYPLGLRLYLPGLWLDDGDRLDRAGVPEAERRALTKGDIALELLDRVRGEGLPGWLVVAGPGCGTSASFRDGVAARGLRYIAEVTDDFEVFPEVSAEVRPVTPGPCLPLARRRPMPVRELIRPAPPLPRTYNECSRRRPPAHVLWRRVWPAQSWATEPCADAEPLWLLAEEREDGRVRYALSNLAADTSLTMALRLFQSRWLMELDYRMMNERLGLNHFEGRSWRGFHHHACMIMLAFGFLALQAKQFPHSDPIPELGGQVSQ